jgi:transcriptional regulator with XRE-family HTH domain
MKNFERSLSDIGDKLRILRLRNGYKSYETFAFENNLSRMHYWRIEKGKTNLTVKTLVKILEIHHVTIEEFFTEFERIEADHQPTVNVNKEEHAEVLQ